MTAVALKTKSNRSRLRGVALQIALHGSVLALWEIACRTVIPPLFLPAPSAIAAAFYDTLLSGELPRHWARPWRCLVSASGSRSSSGSRSGS